MVTIWAYIMLGAAITIALGILGLGVFMHNDRRARSVKVAENDDTTVQHVVEQLRIYHPEINKRDRLDRHWFYVALPGSVLCYAVCLFGGAKITNNVATLSQGTRLTMGVCFTIGALFVLFGAVLGTRIGPLRIGRRVRGHPTAPLLGDDITLPYRLGMLGLCAITISLAIYSWTSFQTTVGSLGGWMTGFYAFVSFCMIPNLYIRIKDFERDEHILLTELAARRECDHHDGD